MKDKRAIIKKLNRTLYLHHMKIRKIAIKHDLHFGQMPVLEYISDHPGCTQVEIANDLLVSLPSISTSIKRMEKNGMVEKKADSTDQRNTRIYVTKLGILRKEKCRSEFNELDDEFFKCLEEEELEELNVIFDKLINNNPVTTQEKEDVIYDKKISKVCKKV